MIAKQGFLESLKEVGIRVTRVMQLVMLAACDLTKQVLRIYT
jgi:hypothetical protein